MVAFLGVLLTPVVNKDADINNWIDDIRYRFQHTGQVIYLEKVLNEYFLTPGYDHQHHETTKMIYISDGTAPDQLYIYKAIEELPVFLGDEPVYLKTQAEIDAENVSFVVNVPEAFFVNMDKLRALVNYYKLAGKNYKIMTY